MEKNTQALSFGKNACKIINTLPCVSLPLIVNNGCLYLFVWLIVSTQITSGKWWNSFCCISKIYVRPIGKNLWCWIPKIFQWVSINWSKSICSSGDKFIRCVWEELLQICTYSLCLPSWYNTMCFLLFLSKIVNHVFGWILFFCIIQLFEFVA